MKEEPTGLGGWQPVLGRMFEELRSGSSRTETYWAQQLAFGPVFIHAVILAVRKSAIAEDDLELLRRILPMALSLLGALPDGSDGDPASLYLPCAAAGSGLGVGPAPPPCPVGCTSRRSGIRLALRSRTATLPAPL